MPGHDMAEGSLTQRIDAIEAAYEFMLAYAAQGAVGDGEGSEIHRFLGRLAAALDGLAGTAAAAVPPPLADAAAPFVALIEADASRALTAVRLVLACRRLGSQLVDNLNASLHLRTLLTDLFLIDEALKG